MELQDTDFLDNYFKFDYSRESTQRVIKERAMPHNKNNHQNEKTLFGEPINIEKNFKYAQNS